MIGALAVLILGAVIPRPITVTGRLRASRRRSRSGSRRPTADWSPACSCGRAPGSRPACHSCRCATSTSSAPPSRSPAGWTRSRRARPRPARQAAATKWPGSRPSAPRKPRGSAACGESSAPSPCGRWCRGWSSPPGPSSSPASGSASASRCSRSGSPTRSRSGSRSTGAGATRVRPGQPVRLVFHADGRTLDGRVTSGRAGLDSRERRRRGADGDARGRSGGGPA